MKILSVASLLRNFEFHSLKKVLKISKLEKNMKIKRPYRKYFHNLAAWFRGLWKITRLINDLMLWNYCSRLHQIDKFVKWRNFNDSEKNGKKKKFRFWTWEGKNIQYLKISKILAGYRSICDKIRGKNYFIPKTASLMKKSPKKITWSIL